MTGSSDEEEQELIDLLDEENRRQLEMEKCQNRKKTKQGKQVRFQDQVRVYGKQAKRVDSAPRPRLREIEEGKAMKMSRYYHSH